MDIETFRNYCLAKKGVTESFPFGEETLVFKVMNKMFAATGLEAEEFTVNLKCEPHLAEEWRATYPEVRPGYHMNKKHWNTVHFEAGLEEGLLREMIDLSYDLVVKGMRKKDREELEKL